MGKKEGSPALAEGSKLIDRLIEDPSSEPFRKPVLWKEWGLLDYPDIVKEPMDLGSIQKKLQSNKYKDFDSFSRDVKLVWSNCMAYNADGSELFKLAKRFEKQCERDFIKLAKKLDMSSIGSADNSKKAGTAGKQGSGSGGGSSGGRGPTAEEKASFCKSIYELNEISLGKLITTLDELCEAALIRNSSDDIEINVDAIDMQSFRKAESFVKKMLTDEKYSSGKKRKLTSGSDTPGKGDDGASNGTSKRGRVSSIAEENPDGEQDDE